MSTSITCRAVGSHAFLFWEMSNAQLGRQKTPLENNVMF